MRHAGHGRAATMLNPYVCVACVAIGVLLRLLGARIMRHPLMSGGKRVKQ
eukprot:SAG22_NODE_474_length_10034_cov_21.356517_7_plen_50_part_00